jgi:uncharacterized protein YdhG (YjbR/CyaY superfamily)
MKSATVAEYLAAQPDDVRRVLRRVRTVIRKALPKAEEVISYGMPAYRVNGKLAMFFAGWKSHYSIYPAGSKAVLAHFVDELARYKKSRGTIQLPLDEPVPVKLIERIAKFRAQELAR